MNTRQSTPTDPRPPEPSAAAPREPEELAEQTPAGRQRFFMDIPRAGARERGRTR